MAKIKLNLPTGVSVEKPIITCFEVENKSYLILDAENIGSMGLPIILVCKIEDDRVTKIMDASEWQKAKDYLKGIIAGNSMNYVAVKPEMAADEVYYTQLTLPVASFDVIKNAYKVEEVTIENQVEGAALVSETNLVTEPAISNLEPVVPAVDQITAPVMQPVIDIETPSSITVSESEAPVIPEIPAAPVMPQIPNSEPAIPEVETSLTETNSSENIDFAESKEAFMKACENMFDALVAKFQAQLNSKK